MSQQLHFLPAGAPELVRSNQKDRFYTDYINTLISEVSRQNLPIRLWVRWQREFQLLAELAYYGLTTVFGNQTLGEEYCNTVQVATKLNQRPVSPGVIRRTLAILLQVVGPYLIEKFLERAYKRIRDRSLSVDLSEGQYEQLEVIVSALDDLLISCTRLHLALFYIQGLFYHLGKRVSGIRYLMIRYGNQLNMDGSQSTTYRVLGWLIFVQLSLKIVWWLVKYLRRGRRKRTVTRETQAADSLPCSDVDAEPEITVLTHEDQTAKRVSLKCPLCLEPCRVQTATPCGHVFCWQCVTEWANEKTECPLCRSRLEPQQLVCLQHFSV